MKGSSVIQVGVAKPSVRLIHAILLTIAGGCIVGGALMLVFQKSLREFFSEEPVDFEGYRYTPEFRKFPLFLSQVVGQVLIRGEREVVGRLISEGMTFEEGTVIATGDEASVLINLEDMLALQLGASSEVVFERIVTRADDADARTVQLRCKRGEVFVASFLDSPDATVTIHTATHTIVGARARFEVSVSDEMVRVTVLDGEVQCFLNKQPDRPITLLGGSQIAHPLVKTVEGGKIVAGTEEQLAVREVSEADKAKLENRTARLSAMVRKAGAEVSPAFYEAQTKKIKHIVETCRKKMENFELLPYLEYVKWPFVLDGIPLDQRRLTEVFLEFTEPFETLRLEILQGKIAVTFFGRENERKAISLFPGTLEVIYKGTLVKRSRKFLVQAKFVLVGDKWLVEEMQILETWCPHVPYREK